MNEPPRVVTEEQMQAFVDAVIRHTGELSRRIAALESRLGMTGSQPPVWEQPPPQPAQVHGPDERRFMDPPSPDPRFEQVRLGSSSGTW